MIGTATINIFILLVVTALLLGAIRLGLGRYRITPHRSAKGGTKESHRYSWVQDLLVGGASAFVIFGILVLLRKVPVVTQIVGITHSGTVLWTTFVVFLEEFAKLSIVSLHRPGGNLSRSARRNTRTNATETIGTAPLEMAIRRGWGFALMEHTFYLVLVPSRLVVRVVLTGVVHISTTAFYAWPQSPHRSRVVVSTIRLGIAITAHTAFNLLVTSLDTILTIL